MTYALAPIGKATVVGLAVILALLPAMLVIGVYLSDAQDMSRTLLTAFGVAMIAAILLLGSIRRREVTFDGRTLVIKAAFWTRRAPVDALDVDGARVVDLAERTELRPLLRMNGYSLPGFRAGHYRLRNMQKAFALLTARDRVLTVPERGGTLLLLSLERPQLLLDAILGSDQGKRGQTERV